MLKYKAFIFIIAFSIPGFLAVSSMQARKYTKLEKEVLALERQQKSLIRQNENLIENIVLLSSLTRIERIARNELAMRKAESEEIIRVKILAK